MEIAISSLAVVVSILAFLQGYQVITARRNRNNNPSYGEKLDTIISKLGAINTRVNDIWDKVKGQ